MSPNIGFSMSKIHQNTSDPCHIAQHHDHHKHDDENDDDGEYMGGWCVSALGQNSSISHLEPD